MLPPPQKEHGTRNTLAPERTWGQDQEGLGTIDNLLPTPHTLSGQNDTRLRKRYLSTASLAFSKIILAECQLSVCLLMSNFEHVCGRVPVQ